MTIRQKIRVSNIMMALIPILLTAIIVTVCLNTSLGSYWYTLETMYQDENGIQSAQSLIYTYQQELWENNWGGGVHTELTEDIIKNEKMNHLEKKLSKMGYHFLIRKNGHEIFSNISEEEMEKAESVAGTAIASAKTLTASYHDVSVIKHTFYHGEKAFSIIAVHSGGTDQTVISYLQNYILKYILGFIIAFLVLTVCVNAILSWWITKSVLCPLKKLSHGTKDIRDGNLDTMIAYTKADEFGEACRDFDEMRVYSKTSVEQRLKDEQKKKDLITGISHDLRTPLTSISGGARSNTGEAGGNYYLSPDLVKDLVQSVNGTIMECNTAYSGSRSSTAMHRQVASDHGYTAIAEVDIMDENGSLSIPVTGEKNLTEDLVGENLEHHDSMMVLFHFRGHSMGGFKGAIKSISIGVGSADGKRLIHSGGKSSNSWGGGTQDEFLESMAEAAEKLGITDTTIRYYDEEGLLPYVSRKTNGFRAFCQKI